MMLELAGVEAAYGHAQALHGIDLVVDEGEVVCIVGSQRRGQDEHPAEHVSRTSSR